MYSLLIVDDEISVLRTLSTTIPWEDVEVSLVLTARSAHQALELIASHRIDIVISDIKMPIMTGLELAQHLHLHHSSIKCILLTGYAEFDFAKQAIASKVVEFLIKPASDEKILSCVREVTAQLSREWEELIAYQRTQQMLEYHKPLLQHSFLQDILEGKSFTPSQLLDHLKVYELSLDPQYAAALCTVRPEDPYYGDDPRNLQLFKYAVANIAQETFRDLFVPQQSTDSFGNLVFLVQFRPEKEVALREQANADSGRDSLLQEYALKLQANVNKYLKGTVSIAVSRWGLFPDDMHAFHQKTLSLMRRKIGNDPELFITDLHEPAIAPMETVESLYTTPTLNHLLDTARWEEARRKVNAVCDEIAERWGHAEEYLVEAYYAIAGAIAYCAHRNGKRLDELFGDDYPSMLAAATWNTAPLLKNWSRNAIDRLEQQLASELHSGRSSAIQKVKQYIETHLEEDISMQTLADIVFLHPVYLSKIFKLETGGTLSDYILGRKMERASWLIRSTNMKMIDISGKLGYQHQTYFFKVFKKYFGMTPQEFREMNANPSSNNN